MRKPKDHDEDADETHFFDDFESDDSIDDEDAPARDARKHKRPARQRVELRNEQQTLRRQLSDWEDYEQDDFDTKL